MPTLEDDLGTISTCPQAYCLPKTALCTRNRLRLLAAGCMHRPGAKVKDNGCP